MKEEFLHFIWQQQLYNSKDLVSSNGECLFIRKKGFHNQNDGPDFLEGKVQVDSTTLVGSIEIHVFASDWRKHKHSTDKRYDNVILHVVWIEDVDLSELNCPTLELQGRVSRYYLDNYNMFMKKTKDLPCKFFVKSIDEHWLNFYKEKILIERLESKSNGLKLNFSEIKNQKIYEVFISTLGEPSNKYGFLKLTSLLPIKLLQKYKGDLWKLEALLFGVGGFLKKEVSKDSYFLKLREVFRDLTQLHQLEIMSKEDWVFLRIRPAGFPTIKLALLASLFNAIESLENLVLKSSYNNFKQKLLELEPNEFWNTHYTFNKDSTFRKKGFGKTTYNKLLLNCFLPLRLIYSINYREELDLVLNFMRNLPKENNSILNFMSENGFENQNAYDSQFNLHKNKHYCIPRKCINCGIGQKIIKKHD